MGLKAGLFKVASLVLQQPWARLTRGMTLGSRVVVLDDQAQVLLVRHTYSPGWILPGGGVEKGETLVAAALREIKEEAGIVGQSPVLHGMFSNEPAFKGDHVACFIVRQFNTTLWQPNHEIAEARFFPVIDLPHDTTGGTKRRLAEILNGVAVSELW
jgi:8-oxo-dGTP pyrophosphatase MutT (NUDIX family)